MAKLKVLQIASIAGAIALGTPHVETIAKEVNASLDITTAGVEVRFQEKILTVQVQDTDYLHLAINGDLCPDMVNCSPNTAHSIILRPQKRPLLPPDPKSIEKGTLVTVVTENRGQRKTHYFRARTIQTEKQGTAAKLSRPSTPIESLDPIAQANRLASGLMWHKKDYAKNRQKWKAINTAILLLRRGNTLDTTAKKSGVANRELLELINSGNRGSAE